MRTFARAAHERARAAVRRSWPALALIVVAAVSAGTQANFPPEEQAVRAVLARFYDGWNEHDADKMVSAYAEDAIALGGIVLLVTHPTRRTVPSGSQLS